MEEQLISYETAKLAKEKGYLREIPPHVDLESDEEMYKIWDKWNNEISLEYRGTELDCEEGGEEIDAPPQSVLQKWLREEHKIDIFITPDECYSYGEVYDVSVCRGNDKLVEMCSFMTWEEALEGGLKEALKLIDYEKTLS